MIELPWPAKILWPNGRGNHFAKSRETKKHKAWAYAASLSVHGASPHIAKVPIRLRATFHPKTRHAVDKDNASASLKAYQDGIALALGVNDATFGEPAIHFGEPVKGGKVVIVVEAL